MKHKIRSTRQRFGWLFNLTVIIVLFAAILIASSQYFDRLVYAQNAAWMTVMLRCGGALESSGEHVTLHGSADDAKAHGDRELQSGRYDIAYVEERTGQFYTLRWVKSSSERCYGGSFREWSQDF